MEAVALVITKGRRQRLYPPTTRTEGRMTTGVSKRRDQAVDPVTVEVIRNGLIGIARAMKTTIIRTAYSTTVQEAQDFSVAIFLGTEMVAQAEGVAGHLGTMPHLVGEMFRRYPLEQLDDGDLLITNDPYAGCAHTPDFTLAEIRRIGGLPFLPVARAHWSDVGGMSPGSISGKATEVYQEGLRVPISHLYHAGKLNRALYDTIIENVRLPEERAGDIRAQVAACRIALARLEELVAKYGADVVETVIGVILDRTEKRMRDRIAALPDGVYEYEDYLDSDGHTPEPRIVHLRLEVEGSNLNLDFTGSSPQATGPTNSALPATYSGACVALKALLDPEWPANAGFYRPIHVHAPEGTMVNARKPAATGSTHEVNSRVVDVVLGALAGLLPDRVAAANYGSINHTYMGGVDPASGRPYVWYEYPAGGMGATRGRDGADASHTVLGGDTKDFAIERLEAEYPLLCDEYRLRVDSGGPGEWRGGMGVIRRIRLLDTGERQAVGLSCLWDRSRIPPFGVHDGLSGAPQRVRIIRADGGEDLIPVELGTKTTLMPLFYRDVVSMETAGAGGYGDALDRDPARVADDVAGGLVTIEAAERQYGVVIDAQTGHVDAPATKTQRDALRAARTSAVVAACDALFVGERRTARLHAAFLDALGVNEDFVEVVGSWPAPLRLWAIRDESVEVGSIGLDETARRITGLRVADLAVIRTLVTDPAPPCA